MTCSKFKNSIQLNIASRQKPVQSQRNEVRYFADLGKFFWLGSQSVKTCSKSEE